MSIGESKTVTITTGGNVALLLFDGIAGQRVSVKATNCTISTGAVNIYNPDRTALIAPGSFTLGNFFYEPQQLFRTGTYTILIDPDNAYTGSITLTLYDVPPDLSSTIAIGGAPVSVTTTTPGQNALITFSAAAGQQVSLSANSSNIASWMVSLVKPDGLTSGSTQGVFIDNTALPTIGAYTILVNPALEYIGAATLTLYNVADVTGVLTIGASPVSTTIIYPGQRSKLTFSGTAGQKVSLQGSNNTIGEGTLSIQNPDGTTLTSIAGLLPGSPFLDTKTLAATGSYTVVVDPINTQVGSISIRVYDVVDLTGTITSGGPPVTVTTTTPGQNGLLTFAGTSGQVITIHLTNNSIGAVTLKLLKPDGSQLGTISGSGSFNLSNQTVPTSGTYSIVVDPSGSNIGSLSISVTSP